MTALEVVIWFLVGGGVLGIAIALLGLLLLGIEAAIELHKRFKR